MIAERKGIETKQLTNNFAADTKIAIASCSK